MVKMANPIYCTKCEEEVTLDGIDYDGVRISCGCTGASHSAYMHTTRLTKTAPLSWQYESARDGSERRLNR